MVMRNYFSTQLLGSADRQSRLAWEIEAHINFVSSAPQPGSLSSGLQHASGQRAITGLDGVADVIEVRSSINTSGASLYTLAT